MKRLIALILVLVQFFGVVGCSAKQEKEPFVLDDYKTEVTAISILIAENAVLYAGIAEYQKNYMKSANKLGDIVTSEKLLKHASEWLLKETGYDFEHVETQYDGHSAIYKEIVLTEVEGKEAEEIETLFREFFAAYSELRNLALHTIDSYEDYADKCDNAIDSFMDAQSKLASFLR